MDNKAIDNILDKISFSYINNLDDTYKKVSEIYNISLKNDYLKGKVKSQTILGHILIYKGNFNESSQKLREAYEGANKLENIDLIVEIINLLGSANMLVENYEVALDYYLMGLNIIDDKKSSIRNKYYQDIGNIYRRLGDFNLAMTYFNKLLNENIKYTNKYIYELVLSNISQIMIYRKQFDEVRDILEEGFDIAHKIGDNIGQAYISKIMANYYEEIEEYKEADKWYTNSFKLFSDLKEGLFKYETLIDYCKMLLKQDKDEEAIRILEKNLEIVKNENKTILIQKFSIILAKTYSKHGYIDTSNKYYEMYYLSSKDKNKNSMDNRLKGIKTQQNLISILHEKKLLKIENDKLEFEYRKLMEINDIVKEITAAQTVQDLVISTYTSLRKTMTFYSFSIGLYDKDTGKINCNFCKDKGKSISQKDILVDDKNSFLACVIRNKQDLVLLNNSDYKKKRKYVNDNVKGSFTENGEFLETEIYLLLEFKGNIIGIMSIKSKRKNAFSKSELEVLYLLRSFIAIALSNTYNKVKLEMENEIRKNIQNKLEVANEKLLNISKTDVLTNLKNRYSLYLELPLTIKKAKELDSYMTVNMVDLDYFKEFNDANGHVAGDICLENIGIIFNEIAKEHGAKVYRYGGDEFIFTYTLNEVDYSKILAEKIRLSVEKLKYSSFINHRKKHLTASVGVVLLKPNINYEIDRILEYVDKALYEAKKDNKNTVALHVIDYEE